MFFPCEQTTGRSSSAGVVHSQWAGLGNNGYGCDTRTVYQPGVWTPLTVSLYGMNRGTLLDVTQPYGGTLTMPDAP